MALSGVNRVVRVDPVTNSVTQVIEVGNEPGALGVSAHAVWVANTVDDTVSRIDPDTSLEVDAIQVGDGPSGISVVQETVWVTNEWDGTLSRIEPGQVSARKIALGSVPQGLAGANGNLWVSVRGTATPHEGGTLRVVSRNAVGTLDTSVAYGVFEWAALHLIGDGLVAFEPTGGTNAKLVPNLATAIPTPTDGGRTYTFEVRSGIPYSNGEIVAPADFRHAIERGFRLDPSDFGDIYGGLVGGAACANDPRGCDLSEGIITDDAKGAITFNLVAPDPDFLNKLTMPFAYPVPPSVPDEEQVTTGIPGTGPYMLNAPMTDGGLVFVPNPHFQVWSQAARPDGYPNQIVWTFRVDPQAQVEAVAAGDADLAMNADEYGQLEELFVGSAAQVHTAPTPLTIYTVLNTRVPPFDNVDVRRAVNFAIDRDRIAEILGGEAAARPTCQQLPPNFPGYEPYCPYTTDPAPEGSWIGPDIEEAKRLVRRSGTAGMNIVIEIVPWQSQAKADLLGDYLIGMLKELGYRGRVLALSYDDFYDRRTEFQMAVDAWGEDYPAASNFITPFLTCDAYWIPSSGFCDPGIDTMIDRASQMQVDDPVAAGALWGEIDRRIVDQAPYHLDGKYEQRRVRFRSGRQLPGEPSMGRTGRSALGPVAVVRAREFGWSVRVAAAARDRSGLSTRTSCNADWTSCRSARTGPTGSPRRTGSRSHAARCP